MPQETLTDVHAHICDPVFDPDRGEVIRRAGDAGISSIIAVSETPADAQKNLALAEEYHEILPAAGLYPTILDFDQAELTVNLIRRNHHRLTAIGEVGLDYWKVGDEEDRIIQREIFSSFIELGREFDLPLNIHSRSAGHYVIEMLLEAGVKRALLHAFDGRASASLPAVEAGYYFSIPPSVVRSRQKQKLVKKLPLSAILLETDSPVLGPVPNQRNEPANLIIALKAVAELKNLTERVVREAVIDNFNRLFAKRAN